MRFLHRRNKDMRVQIFEAVKIGYLCLNKKTNTRFKASEATNSQPKVSLNGLQIQTEEKSKHDKKIHKWMTPKQDGARHYTSRLQHTQTKGSCVRSHARIAPGHSKRDPKKE